VLPAGIDGHFGPELRRAAAVVAGPRCTAIRIRANRAAHRAIWMKPIAAPPEFHLLDLLLDLRQAPRAGVGALSGSPRLRGDHHGPCHIPMPSCRGPLPWRWKLVVMYLPVVATLA